MNLLISFATFGSIILPILFFGFYFGSFLKIRSIFERLGLSIIFGTLFSSIFIMIGYILIAKFSILFTISLLLVTSILLKIFSKIKLGKEKVILLFEYLKIRLKTLNKIEIYSLTFIVIVLIFTFISNLIWPVNEWDSIALYDFRARIIATSGSWKRAETLSYFFHIPPFTSIIHSFSYLSGLYQAKFWYSFLFLGFISTFYGLLRRKVIRKIAILGSAFLLFAPFLVEHINIAYTNLPFTIFFSLSIIYAWEWIDSGNINDAVISFILGGGAIWTRQLEPFWIILLILLFFGKYINKKTSSHLFVSGLVIFIGIKQFWPAYVSSLPININPNVIVEDAVFMLLEPITLKSIFSHSHETIKLIVSYVIKPFSSLLFPILTLIIFDKRFTRKKLFSTWMISFALFFGMIFSGTLYFSFTFETWNQIGGSMTRMVMFIVPLLIYTIFRSPFMSKIIDKLF